MQLTQTVKRQLETDSSFLTEMLKRYGRVEATVILEEEPGEVLITLLMSVPEIHRSVKQAVEEYFGANYVVPNVSLGCGKQLISFTISKGGMLCN